MINLDIKIKHRNWDEALNMLFALLLSTSSGEVICITGPARTGKTRMIEELIKLLCGPESVRNSAYMNSAYVLVDNDGNNGRFTTKSFIWDALVAIKHPEFCALQDTENITRKFDRSSEAAMKKAFISGAKQRKLKYLFFDEVQHVNYVGKGIEAPHMVLDSWKNMAKQAKVVLVLAGAYPMLDALRNSPHLIGRQYKVNLPRYYETELDLNEYATIIDQYMKHLPREVIGDNLVEHTVYLHQYSYGCIGILRRWLLHAAVWADLHRTRIDLNVLEQTRSTNDDLLSIGNEIVAGEEILFNETEFKTNINEQKKVEKPKKVVKKSQQKAFKAKPRRYEIGGRTKEDN